MRGELRKSESRSMAQVAVLPVPTEAMQLGLGRRVPIGAKFPTRWVELGWVWRQRAQARLQGGAWNVSHGKPVSLPVSSSPFTVRHTEDA